MNKNQGFILRIFIGLIILIVIIFLWKELPDLSLSKKINSEKVSALATSFGALITAITVYFLYKQLEYQIEDRKAATKPDLYPIGLKLFVKGEEKFSVNEIGDGGFYYVPQFIVADNEEKNRIFVSIQIHNIGLAAAKEIKYEWKFDEEEVQKRIHQLYPALLDSSDKMIDFIPAGANVEIKFPESYLNTCGPQLNYTKEEEVEKKAFGKIIINKEKLPLKLFLTFQDIYGSRLSKEFDAKIS